MTDAERRRLERLAKAVAALAECLEMIDDLIDTTEAGSVDQQQADLRSLFPVEMLEDAENNLGTLALRLEIAEARRTGDREALEHLLENILGGDALDPPGSTSRH
jgi:hypothetical protein